MANKDNQDKTPKVTALPLPATDSPLVIDLPDGQKIVVGKMTAGSVIEVATWRGVGRPDSRTSRLMLGMASAQATQDASETQSGNPVPAATGWRLILALLSRWRRNLLQLNWKKFISLPTTLNRKTSRSIPTAQKEHDSKIEPTTHISPDVEEWLNSISQKVSASADRDENSQKKPMKKAAPKKKATTRVARPQSKRK